MIDAIDQKILAILQDAGRTSHAEIGRSLGMAASAIFERVKKLEERGLIRGYGAVLDPAALELGLLAFLSVRTEDPVGGDATARALAKRPEILEVHHVAGEDCYLAKVRVKDTASLSQLLKEVGAIKGVRATRTTVVLETTKEAARLPIAVSKHKKEKA
ncbi:MAG TPA: Lrp/AsnC family transcriptional regulator [Holophagaceae bacterium]|nr:Lrp/AsnC family transcriptional regulator [Holophagaceae bacterium]